MTAAVARTATAHDHRLLPAYVEHVTALGLSDRALRERLRAARSLLAEAPDLTEWMAAPISDRLASLGRTRAWSLVVFAIGTGRLRLDLELMTGKNLTGLGQIVHDQHPHGFAAATEAGLRLGWTPGWVDTIQMSRPGCRRRHEPSGASSPRQRPGQHSQGRPGAV